MKFNYFYVRWVSAATTVVLVACNSTSPRSTVPTIAAPITRSPSDSETTQSIRRQEEALRFARLFGLLTDPSCEEIEFATDVRLISAMPVHEPIQSWIAVVNDGRLANKRRRICLWTMFQRHVKGGTPLSDIGNSIGYTGWFNAQSITTATAYPLKRALDEGVFMFKLPFMQSEGSALFFRVKPVCSKKQFLQLISGEYADKTTRIRGMVFSNPRKERMQEPTLP